MPNLASNTIASTGPGAEEGRRPTIVPGPVAAPAEFGDRARRRRFTAADKLRILAEVDRAAEHRGIGAVLWREGVYSGLVMDWRRQRDAGGLEALAPSKRGPKPWPTNPKAAELAAALKENAALRRRLERAEAIIDLQKKVALLLGDPLSPNDAEL